MVYAKVSGLLWTSKNDWLFSSLPILQMPSVYSRGGGKAASSPFKSPSYKLPTDRGMMK